MKQVCIPVFILTLFVLHAVGQVPVNGLIAHYSFSGNATDETGNGHNGIVTGAQLTEDRFGRSNKAYQFNGSTDYIVSQDAFFNNGAENFTISCWLNASSFTNPNNIINSQVFFNTIPHNGLGIAFSYVNIDNRYMFSVNSNPSPGAVTWDVFLNQASNTHTTINVWNHYVLVKQGSLYSVYINGQLDGSITASKPIADYLCNIVIGGIDPAITVTQGERFMGKLDDYYIYNRALSPFEITALYLDNPLLPLRVTNLTAAYSHGQLQVQWKTANEVTMSHFFIEGSETGQTFSTIGTVAAKNTPTNEYVFTQSSPATIAFIRLRMEDKDGRLSYSTIVRIGGNKSQQSFHISPNPVTTTANLIFTENTVAANISIFDMNGKKVYGTSFTGAPRKHYALNIASLANGMYVVSVTSKNATESHRLLLQRSL